MVNPNKYLKYNLQQKLPSYIRLNWHTPLFSRHGIIKASIILLMA